MYSKQFNCKRYEKCPRKFLRHTWKCVSAICQNRSNKKRRDMVSTENIANGIVLIIVAICCDMKVKTIKWNVRSIRMYWLEMQYSYACKFINRHRTHNKQKRYVDYQLWRFRGKNCLFTHVVTCTYTTNTTLNTLIETVCLFLVSMSEARFCVLFFFLFLNFVLFFFMIFLFLSKNVFCCCICIADVYSSDFRAIVGVCVRSQTLTIHRKRKFIIFCLSFLVIFVKHTT